MMNVGIREGTLAADPATAFDGLYERDAPAILRYLGAAVRDRQVAEDLCADAFCKAWDAWPRFHGSEAEARTWVFRIARNLVIDRARRDGRVKFEVLGQGNAGDGPDPTGSAAGMLDLRRAMSALGRDDRDLLAMRIAGLSHAEISQVQGRSEEAVKKAWQRALLRLRHGLEA